MPPKKTRVVPKVSRNPRIAKSKTPLRKTFTNYSSSSRKGMGTKPVSYELSDDDSMLDTNPNSSGKFYHVFQELESLPAEITAVIDLDESAVELPVVQTIGKPEDLPASRVLPTLNAEPTASVSSTILAQNSNLGENVDAIINSYLGSDDLSLDDSNKKSNAEFLACANKMLSSDSDIVQTNNSSSGKPIKKYNLELESSVIEVIDLSSSNCSVSNCSETNCSVPVINITDPRENSQEKYATSEQSNSSLKQSWGFCPICLEPIGSRTVAATFCGHIFCDACIRSCAKTTRKCPNCRKTLNQKQIHPLFI